MTVSTKPPIGEALISSLAGTAVVAALLLVTSGLAAGVWVWPRAVALIIGYGAIGLVGTLALAIWRPAHFRVRQQSVVAERDKRQPLADAIGSVVLLVFGGAWLAFIGFDVFRWRLLPPPPPGLAIVGGLAVLLGAALYPLAAWENRFATPNVQDQTSAGQEVVQSGVYALVRHPIYLANLLIMAGTSLWLGSYAALGGLVVLVVMTIGRIAIEERDLRARLPAYADYARKVRGRLIPFLL